MFTSHISMKSCDIFTEPTSTEWTFSSLFHIVLCDYLSDGYLSLSLSLSIYLSISFSHSLRAEWHSVCMYNGIHVQIQSHTQWLRDRWCVCHGMTQWRRLLRVCPTVRHRGILLVWLVTSVNTCQWPTYGIQWFSPLYRTQASLSHWVKLQSIFNFIIWFKKFYYHSRTNLLRVRPLVVYLWRVSSKVSSTSPSSHSTTHFPPSPAPTTLHSYHPVKFLNLTTIRSPILIPGPSPSTVCAATSSPTDNGHDVVVHWTLEKN